MKNWYHVIPQDGRPYGFSICGEYIKDHPDWRMVCIHKEKNKTIFKRLRSCIRSIKPRL